MNDFKNINPESEKLLKAKGIDPGKISKEDTDKLFKSLSPEDTRKIAALLNDQKALEQVLSSNKAQMLIKMLMGKPGVK